MLRALIIDDEIKGIDTLSMLIRMYVPDIRVVAHSTKAAEGIELIENYKPEIVFLDINMPEMNGFELLEKLQWNEFNLVFTTAHQEYGLRALKSNAVDYLLKPIDHSDLIDAIDRIKRKSETAHGNEKFNYQALLSSTRQRNKILISLRFGVESVNLDEIMYFESQSNYTRICLVDKKEILSSKTLKEFEQELCAGDTNFMRVHHSFIANLTKVSRYLKVSDCLVMSDDQKIPVAKSRRESFFKWMSI